MSRRRGPSALSGTPKTFDLRFERKPSPRIVKFWLAFSMESDDKNELFFWKQIFFATNQRAPKLGRYWFPTFLESLRTKRV